MDLYRHSKSHEPLVNVSVQPAPPSPLDYKPHPLYESLELFVISHSEEYVSLLQLVDEVDSEEVCIEGDHVPQAGHDVDLPLGMCSVVKDTVLQIRGSFQ